MGRPGDSRDATGNRPAVVYGWGRLLLCFLAPPLLAKAAGARGHRYVETFLWIDIALLLANLVADHGPREGLRRLADEMGLWPPRQRGHSPGSWAVLFTSLGAIGFVTRLASQRLDAASKRPAMRALNWRPLDVGWAPPEGLSRRRVFYLIPLAVFAEETYIRGFLWSRMARLGRWRPAVSGTAWAFYHLNQPIRNVIGSILPGAIWASYAREFTGNIYWTAAAHYLSNAYGAWSSGRQVPDSRSYEPQSTDGPQP